MVDFLRYGGLNTWVLIAIGIPTLIMAVKFARNADPQRLSLIRALTRALVFSTVAGAAANLMVTAFRVAHDEELYKDALRFLLIGVGESLSSVILGSVVASVTWILVAVGVRRMPHDTL